MKTTQLHFYNPTNLALTAFVAALFTFTANTTHADEIIEDKTSQFDTVLDDMTTTSETSSTLASQIRAQRAALDAESAKSAAASANISGANACDSKMRACMQEKCGKDFTKCSGDTDTILGTKLDSCRRDLPCTGEEYRIVTTEIKADIELNAKFALYNSIIDCGNNYNNCIIAECGPKFTQCLGKKKGDAAVQKCSKIANECREQDSGLPSRMMEVFGSLRLDAEAQVSKDEKRLYELRDLMRESCSRLGALFDERTLDCVYSVNFYAGQENTQYASKKAYAGTTFDCTPNWFGIDITTFMENAQRLTRAQTSATNALMGSGMGMAVGAVTSGAIDRAVDRHKADKALKKAEKEHDEAFGDGEDDDKKSFKDRRAERKKAREEKGKEKGKDNNNSKSSNSGKGTESTSSKGSSTSASNGGEESNDPDIQRINDAVDKKMKEDETKRDIQRIANEQAAKNNPPEALKQEIQQNVKYAQGVNTKIETSKMTLPTQDTSIKLNFNSTLNKK